MSSEISSETREYLVSLEFFSGPFNIDLTEELYRIHNTSEHRIQGRSISLVARLSGSGIREDVKLFQKWNVKDSFRIFLNRISC